MTGQRIGYKRVSSVAQNADRQLADLKAPVSKTFTDKASGKNVDGRPELRRAIEYVREGDTLVVHSMDRLARNIVDLHQIVDALTKGGALRFDDKTVECHGGVAVEFVKEGRTFTGDDGSDATLMLGVLGAVAQFERSIIKERQREGIALAKARGVYKGRKPKFTPEQTAVVAQRVAGGESPTELAEEYGVHRSTIYKAVAAARAEADEA
ncbi:recombinase family protein [Gordonia amicalis]|uniref:recombinase family protein n=1 Tax=Gordonia amicalis TaxID=89053 RepID=UPI0024BA3FF6|nr:recombinase family protein [Gordonia amicalis]MDJ0454090.1 recombinase family protein [Gordonia amicalis]MDV7077234.1 recombinase family protein [Gordonia amicalis]